MNAVRSFLLIFVLAAAGLAQNSPEVAAKPATAIFRSSTNLVQVPVVVRDGNGHTVGTLRAEDFHLTDNGKPQIISKFSLEKFETRATAGKASPRPAEADAPASAIQIAPPPDRFVAYLFDDVHMSIADLTYTREAAKRQIDSLNLSRQRVGIFTTSGNQIVAISTVILRERQLCRIHPHIRRESGIFAVFEEFGLQPHRQRLHILI